MDFVMVLGIVAGTCSTISFLPQVIKSWKTRQTEDISLLSFAVFSIAVILWLVYGILIKDIPILLTNVLVLLQTASIIVMKLMFK
jgi:MtN3 and saliva related transmembrane protein